MAGGGGVGRFPKSHQDPGPSGCEGDYCFVGRA